MRIAVENVWYLLQTIRGLMCTRLKKTFTRVSKSWREDKQELVLKYLPNTT